MLKNDGAEVAVVETDSIACSAGIIPGDIIVSINNNKVHDTIDFMFYKDEEALDLLIIRNSKKIKFKLILEEGKDIGIEIKPFRIRTCTNKCIFCFVGQLPKGLRKTLYIKDEDYRMSFLYGNYVTLTNLSAADKKRIVEQRLSPIYISVHSTNKAIRNMILGNPRAQDVLKELSFFKANKIKMHCQIVLCPGINDGKELINTIRDLYRFYPYVLSIAVVPVGLTAHRKTASRVKPFDKDDALQALEIIDSFQNRFNKKHGDTLVYGADELYIKAGAKFPPLREYGDLPQLENGVGMVPLFKHQAQSLTIKKLRDQQLLSDKNGLVKKQFITFTGLSFYPYLKRFTDKLSGGEGLNISTIAVENNFFGKTVTVTGLLTGRDVIRAMSDKLDHDFAFTRKRQKPSAGPSDSAVLLIPDIVLRDGEEVFLDGLAPRDIEETLNMEVRVIEATPAGLINGILKGMGAAV